MAAGVGSHPLGVPCFSVGRPFPITEVVAAFLSSVSWCVSHASSRVGLNESPVLETIVARIYYGVNLFSSTSLPHLPFRVLDCWASVTAGCKD